MHGIFLKNPLQEWFDLKFPKTKINPRLLHRLSLEERISIPSQMQNHLDRQTLGQFFTKSKSSWESKHNSNFPRKNECF